MSAEEPVLAAKTTRRPNLTLVRPPVQDLVPAQKAEIAGGFTKSVIDNISDYPIIPNEFDEANPIRPESPNRYEPGTTYLSQTRRVNNIINNPEFVSGLAIRESVNWTILEREFGPTILKLCIKMLGNYQEAEETKQEVLLKCFRKLESYEQDKAVFSTWLLSIAHHACIDSIRQRKPRPCISESDIPLAFQMATANEEGFEVTEEIIWKDHLVKKVYPLLLKLPPEQKEAVEQYYLKGLTQVQIATDLGVPLGTIKTRIRLGIEKMRDFLSQSGIHNSSMI